MMQREASYAFYVKTRLFGWVLLFVFGTTGALSGVNLSWAAKEKKGSKIKVDYLALAAVLLRDGHPDRALNAIVKVDLQSKEMKPKAKRIQYYTLFGVIRLKRKEFLKAAPLFEQAIKAGETKPLVHLLLAQCYFRLTFYKRAVVALQRAPKSVEKRVGTFLLLGQSLSKMGQKEGAYKVFRRGQTLHPDSLILVRLTALVMIDLGVSRSAWVEVRRYLRLGAPSVSDYLSFAQAFRKSRVFPFAAQLLEEALLAEPTNETVLLQLARVYLEFDQPRTAASLLERAARTNPKLMVEAAELYRRAGLLWRAFYLNAQVIDQKDKIRQRLGLLIELRRFEEAAALAPRLSRLGLLKDQKIVYALAFANFRIGQYKVVERWLKRLTTRSMFAKAIELRRAMSSCKNSDDWWCP